MPDITRPDGEQIRFRSAKTGEHNLDTYLEDAEFGDRPLADILQGVFDTDTGNVRQGLVEFRLNTTTRELESRAGVFGDPDEGYAGTGAFFSRFQGDYAEGTQYRASDYVRISGTTYLVTEDHVAGPTPDMGKFLDLLASPTLAAIGAATGAAANKLLYFTAADTTEFADFTAFGRSLVAAASASATRTLLGLGAAATASLAAFPATTMAGTLTLASDPATAFHAATKKYVDDGLALKADPLGYTPVNRNGDTLTGFLTAHAAPTATLHVATKGYVDTTLTNLVNGKVSKTGDTMSGALTINSDLTVSGAISGSTGSFTGLVSANLQHRRGGGYLTVGTFNVAAYGDGDGKLWWREDTKELTLQPASGGAASLRAGYFNINVQALGTASDSAAAPSFSWTGDTNTGFYRADAATIGVAVGGAATWFITPSGSLASSLTPPTFTTQGKISVAGTGSTFGSSIVISRFDDASTSVAPGLRLGRSRGTVIGDYTALVAGDSIGELSWYGANGTLGTLSARIRATTTEAYTASKSGAQLELGTIDTGSNTFATRMTLESGLVQINENAKIVDGTATGSVANSNADSLVIDGTGNTGLTFLGGTSAVQQILFGDTGSNARGAVAYAHSTDTLSLTAAGASVATFDSGGLTMAASKEIVLADVTPTTGFSAGFRGMPTFASATTAAKAAVGKAYIITGTTINFPSGVFGASDLVGVYNHTTSAITITFAAGITGRLAGTTTTGTRTVQPRGFASVWFINTGECIVSGAGVS